ncbi:hypothetical protein EMGBS8_05260 [Verrucomicrobiota bacterium]|nr:hypothetical protein EMGBS8_05260 [Verrucomicrobiota bacterium]
MSPAWTTRRPAQGWSLFLANANYGFYLISNWPNDAIKVTTAKAIAKKDTWQHVFLTYDGSGKAEGIKLYVDGVMAPLNLEVNKLTTSSQAKTPTRLGQRSTSEFFDGAAQELRFYNRALTGSEANVLAKVDDLRALLTAKPNPRPKKSCSTTISASAAPTSKSPPPVSSNSKPSSNPSRP